LKLDVLLSDFSLFERAYHLGSQGRDLNVDQVPQSKKPAFKLWHDWRSGSGKSTQKGLLALVFTLPAPDKNMAPVFASLRKSFDRNWEHLASNVSYMFYVLWVFVGVTVLYLSHVQPSFNEVYMLVSGEIPERVESAFLLSRLAVWVTFGWLALILIVIFCLQKKLKTMSFLGWEQRIPFVGSFSRTYNFLLLVSLASFNEDKPYSNRDFGGALSEKLFKKLLRDNSARCEQLDFARANGFYSQGLQAVLDELAGEVSVRLFRMRSRFILTAQLGVFLSIGAFVISMYLPIFSMGEVVS
jgi:hypothetical protein